MNNYKLYIKSLDGIWKIADFGSDKPSMNYQSNNLAELKDRQSNYSQNLKLPKSKINSAIFGHSQNIEVNTLIPYRKLECRLFCDEVLISGKSAFITLLKITDSFEVQILSGTADFFTTISNKSMSELDLGTYEVGSKKMTDNYNTTDYYCPVAKYGQSFSFQNEAYPIIKKLNAITKICQGYGYGFTHNLDIGEFTGTNITSLNSNTDSMKEFKCKAHAVGYMGSTSMPEDASFSDLRYVSLNPDDDFPNKYGYLSVLDAWFKYTSGFACTVNLYNKIYSTTETVEFVYIILVNGVEIFSETQTLLNDSEIEYNNEITLQEGDVLYVRNHRTGNVYKHLYADTEINNINVTSVPKGGLVKVSECTGFEKQFDFFKAFVQAFGLLIDVDNDNKIIYAYTFKKIVENKLIAQDWSKKLHRSSADISFQNTNYGQSNILKFKDYDVNDIKIIDSSNFIIDNENLEKEKTLFELPFEAGKEYKGNVFSVAEIPLNQTDENGVETFNGGNPHLVKYLTNIKGRKSVVNIHSENLIEQYYTDLINSLQQYKLIENEFYLTPEDVEKYNPFIPVWIDFYGAYFYVNKIKNFIAGKLTKVEIIKL